MRLEQSHRRGHSAFYQATIATALIREHPHGDLEPVANPKQARWPLHDALFHRLRQPAQTGTPFSSRSLRMLSPFLTSAAMMAGLPSNVGSSGFFWEVFVDQRSTRGGSPCLQRPGILLRED
jgi:hypothetical protein